MWLNELNQLGPINCPKLLLGLKSDLRDDFLEKEELKSNCISTEAGEQAMNEFNFQGYSECSAKTGEGLNNVFFEVMKIHFTLKENKKNKIIAPVI